MQKFFVADLNVKGELQLQAEYRYAQLEPIAGAADLIARFSSQLWQTPEVFETVLSDERGRMRFRWRACAPTAGVATLRAGTALVSLSLLASGLEAGADEATLRAFQQHLVRELHDTGIEPAFDLLSLTQRPLVATINFTSPDSAPDQWVAALTDRCYAAGYFRYLQLA
jgi:hypothetical protein